MALKARVKAGRLVVDEPTNLVEGTEVELLPLDRGDWLTEEDRAPAERLENLVFALKVERFAFAPAN